MIGSSLSGISFSGLSSGIDSESIISRLLQIEAIPINRLESQKAQLQSRQTILQQLKGQVSNLAGAGSKLNSASTYQAIKAASSDTAVATMSAGTSSQAGTYELTVSKLAKAHKVSSSAQANTTDALGYSGTFVVNGEAVEVTASDTLKTLAQKINDKQAGVVASVLDGGTNNAYLTITSSKSGASNKAQVADLSGTVAADLGLISGGSSIRSAITNGATSVAFTSSSTAVGELMGVSGLGSLTFSVNSVDVTVDFDDDSLQDIANAINAAGTGATASVRSETVDGTTVYHLDISGASTPTFTDPDSALHALGILQQGFGSVLVTAQDAEYTLDGVSLTSATNTVTGVIPDVTLTLLQADETTPKTSTLTLTRDDEKIVSNVKEVMNAFNSLIDFIRANSAFDKETFQSGPLFGDSTARQVEDTVSNLIFRTVDGLTGTYTNLADIGFSFDDQGKLTLDESQLSTAIASNLSEVSAVFRAMGSSTANTLTYISSTDKTVASGSGYYSVNITQLATKGDLVAGVAQSSNTASSEILTFSGSLFGSTPYDLLVPSGYSQSAVVDLINNDSKLQDIVVATVEGGFLKIASKNYGTSNDFTVVSNVAAASDSTGIGLEGESAKTDALDVAGTINGEEATGNGQYLTGNSGNATTDGLQIQYAGTTLGDVGSIQLTHGIGALLQAQINSMTDSINGLFAANDQSIQTQVETIDDSIERLTEALLVKKQSLQQRFAAMEQAISQLQTQQTRLSSMFG